LYQRLGLVPRSFSLFPALAQGERFLLIRICAMFSCGEL